MATTTKAAAPAKKSSGFGGVKDAWIIMAICCVIAYCFYFFVLGNPDNFVGGDPKGHPLPGNLMGTVYKGGVVVGVILTLLLSVICLGVERFFALKSAFGTMNLAKFTAQVKAANNAGKSDEAQLLLELLPFAARRNPAPRIRERVPQGDRVVSLVVPLGQGQHGHLHAML